MFVNVFGNFFETLHENWIIIALVVSEVAAFLPSKVSGIVKTVVSVVGKIIKATADNKKNK